MNKGLVDLIKNAGLRVTPARVGILGLFSSRCKPMSAEDIFSKTKKNNFDLVTIYRTLASFEKAGIIRKLDLRKDSAYYELSKGHHHHLTCKSCSRVEEIDECGIEGYIEKIAKQSKNFNKISDHSLEFFGLCKTCAKG